MPDYEIAVAGGGPAGLTAALFAARHGRSTVLLDPLGSGGAILNTERVEDFPGFPEGVPGFELGPRMQGQVIDAGGAFEMSEVTRIEPRGGDWSVVTDAGEVGASAVIVATGSRPRKLGVPREEAFEGRGLSTCASCDGPLYRGRVVAVCGDGDSALDRDARARATRRAGGAHPPRRGPRGAGVVRPSRAGERARRGQGPDDARGDPRRRTGRRHPRARPRDGGRVDPSRCGGLRERRSSPEHRDARQGSLPWTSAGASPRTSGCGPSARACSQPVTYERTRRARRSPPPATARQPPLPRTATSRIAHVKARSSARRRSRPPPSAPCSSGTSRASGSP